MREPIIIKGYLENAGYPTAFSLESDEWETWLGVNRKFKIQTVSGEAVTVFKLDGYWVAQKRVKGKLRQKRLGNSQMLSQISWAFLAEIADALNSQSYDAVKQSNDPDYLREKLTQKESEIHMALEILREAIVYKANSFGKGKALIKDAIALLESQQETDRQTDRPFN